VPLVEQELLTLPEHLSSPPVLSGVRVSRFLVLFARFVNRCLSFWSFSFDPCVVCPSSIYGFWLPLWYNQTLLSKINFSTLHITIPHEHVKTSLAEIVHKTWLTTSQNYSFGSRINIYRRQNGSGNESKPLHFSILCLHVPVFYRPFKVWLSRSALS
jgi:hypothetical protein